MATYIFLVVLWTAYMAYENYAHVRPQSRPYFVGFLITHALLAPFSFALSATGGILRERVVAAYSAARRQKEDFAQTDRKKLIG